VVTLPHIEPVEIVPEDIPLDILYEDADVIVLDKRAGMVVHPGPSHERGTLVNALLFHHPSMDFGDTERPGIVHRLDKDTSGVMVVAKHPDAAQALMDQWRHGAVQKHYIAVVAGVLSEDEAVVDVPIARHGSDRKRMAVDRSGRQALTIARVRERLDSATLLDVDLKTGRTHQIRVHLSYIGHPVLGDTVYGTSPSRERSKKLDIARQLLHAHTLTFTPPSRNEATTFTSPIPRDMVGAVSRLRESDQEGASIEPGIAY
jgi:23S rRNA pseudouridine1911/1915/1917 synthase